MTTRTLGKTGAAADTLGTPIIKSTHNVFLAGLGVLAVARQGGENVFGKGFRFFDTLVSEGVKFERKLRNATATGAAEARQKLADVAGRLPRAEMIGEVLGRTKPEPVTYHLVPRDEHWAVRREGNDTNIVLLATKAAALDAARGVAQAHEPSRLVVHRSDGTVQTSHSYGDVD